MHEKTYNELKQEVDDNIRKMQIPQAKFDFRMVKDSLIMILAMLNKSETVLSERLNDCKNGLRSISDILKACHQVWFEKKKSDANTAYRQVLLASVVVRMVELTNTNINASPAMNAAPLPKTLMFSYFTLMGFFVLENGWQDKIIDSFRKDFAQRYMNTENGCSGEVEEIKPDDVGQPEITSDGQLDKLNKYLKVLLVMLLCTSQSQAERLDILAENVGFLSGVRDYYAKRFPEEYEQAFEKCLAIAKEMEQAYRKKGVWETGKILEQVCLDRYRKWKMRATAMDAQIG
ncbi:hypothetical protein Ciccas_011649, partial [Cichlidogyrus casuarinus]